MALSVLDGNQSATTLSSVVTGGEHIVAHSVVSLGANAISNITSAVSGSVVTIPSLAHLGNSVATDGVLDATTNFIKIGGHQSGVNQTAHIVHVSNGGAMSVDASGSSVTFSAITGSASILNFPSTQAIAGTVTANVAWQNGEYYPFKIDAEDSPQMGAAIVFQKNGYGSAIVGDNNPLPISGTVTVGNSVTVSALPSGALTTRFGSVTTANLSQLTSCVTNTSRKYLLAQNISAGTVTIGIGFSPTTTQGIQLTAGAGLTFDAFCPTGAVYWLGATTGATWTILEG